MKKIICLTLMIFISVIAFSQNKGGITVFGTIYNGDTIPVAYLEPIRVVGYICPLTPEEIRSNSKLIRDVKKTYPYAKQIQQLLNNYLYMMSNCQNDSQKEKIKKTAANDIDNKFSGKIKKLSKKQGKILSKLIYRQTGRSSYSLMKDFMSGFKASFYKTATKTMGINLNDNFEPQNDSEDRMIERIVSGIENGKL